jgi:hypothetical protein
MHPRFTKLAEEPGILAAFLGKSSSVIRAFRVRVRRAMRDARMAMPCPADRYRLVQLNRHQVALIV